MPEFVGRRDLTRDAWKALEHTSVLLSGARRVGKSRLLAEMSHSPRPGFRLVRVDVQGLPDVRAFVDAVRDALGAASLGGLRDRVKGVEAAGFGIQLTDAQKLDPWRELEGLLTAESPTLVLALDEVPWWLDAIDEKEPGAARSTLARMRRLRQDPRLAHVRWILTGSAGLSGRAIGWGASAELNDLDRMIVPPLSVAAGRTLFETECPRAAPEAAVVAHQVGGGSPHWISLIASRCRSRSTLVDGAVVEEEVERLLGTPYRDLFADDAVGHFHRRYTPADHQIAQAILGALSRSDDAQPILGVTALAMAEGHEKADVRRVLLDLVDDFLITEEAADRVRFTTPLFRRWWQKWGHR